MAMPLIDGFAIIKNEEEQVWFMLECYAQVRELLGTLSIVDNGSSDNTIHIVEHFQKAGLPIIIQSCVEVPHHGYLRDMALSKCKTSPWVFYMDADETWTVDMLAWLKSGIIEQRDIWDIFKYSTIHDCYHFTEGGNSPSTRIFRNLPGVHFSQEIHTYPQGVGLNTVGMMDGPLMFDHTGCKSREALWAKGQRYQWAFNKVVGIGPATEYVWRVDMAEQAGNIHEFPEDIKARIFTGPTGVKP
jgi:glycosyltransferase involved in cell wall biosynthesis